MGSDAQIRPHFGILAAHIHKHKTGIDSQLRTARAFAADLRIDKDERRTMQLLGEAHIQSALSVRIETARVACRSVPVRPVLLKQYLVDLLRIDARPAFHRFLYLAIDS